MEKEERAEVDRRRGERKEEGRERVRDKEEETQGGGPRDKPEGEGEEEGKQGGGAREKPKGEEEGKQGGGAREKIKGKREGEEREEGKKKRRGVRKVLVVGGSMIRGIEKDLGELLGKGFEAKVVSMSGAKIWDVRKHLGKWTKGELDCVVVHVGTSHIQRGSGILDVGMFGREVERLVEEVDRQCGKGVGVWSGMVPRVDQGEAGLKSVREGNEELVRVMKRKGWGYISHWREFLEGSRVREEWFRDGLHCKEGEGRDALTKGIGRGVMQWVEGAGKQQTGN